MTQIKEKIERLLTKNDKVQKAYLKIREHFWFYFICAFVGIYLYGIVINSMINAMRNFTQGTMDETVSLNPIKCFTAVFTPQGLFLFLLCMC